MDSCTFTIHNFGSSTKCKKCSMQRTQLVTQLQRLLDHGSVSSELGVFAALTAEAVKAWLPLSAESFQSCLSCLSALSSVHRSSVHPQLDDPRFATSNARSVLLLVTFRLTRGWLAGWLAGRFDPLLLILFTSTGSSFCVCFLVEIPLGAIRSSPSFSVAVDSSLLSRRRSQPRHSFACSDTARQPSNLNAINTRLPPPLRRLRLRTFSRLCATIHPPVGVSPYPKVSKLPSSIAHRSIHLFLLPPHPS